MEKDPHHKLLYKTYQLKLLAELESKFRGASFNRELIEAFLNLPRHDFIKRFSVDGDRWLEVTHDNLQEYIPLLYADHPLLLYDGPEGVSTISQPTFVLGMLAMLDLRPGMKVLELGAGSGWNAAMMGDLVGPKGEVHSYEIIPYMAEYAKRCMSQFRLPQVEIIEGDATDVSETNFDRGIFTAGAYDLPACYYQAIKHGGRLLFVLKLEYGDLLLVLEKEHDHFVCRKNLRCGFVPVTGKAPQASRINEIILSYIPSRIFPKGAKFTLAPGEKVIEAQTSSYTYFA